MAANSRIQTPPYQASRSSQQWDEWFRMVNDLLDNIATDLGQISNVDIESAADGDILNYDSTAAQWRPASEVSGQILDLGAGNNLHFADGQFIVDDNGNELFQFNKSNNATHFLTLQNGSSTTPVKLGVSTSDATKPPLWLRGHSSAAHHVILGDTFDRECAIFDCATSEVNRFLFTSSATGAPLSITSEGTDTEVDIAITPLGTGAISVAAVTDYENNVTVDDDIPNKKFCDDTYAVVALPDIEALNSIADVEVDAEPTDEHVLTFNAGTEVWENQAGGSGGGPTNGTAVTLATGSPTAVTFSSIPAGTSRITISIDGMSTSGTSMFGVTIGDSGGLETTGYQSSASDQADISTSTAAFIWNNGGGQVAAASYSGSLILTHLDSNTWVYTGNCCREGANNGSCSGSKTLSGELTQLSLTTAGGSDTFDAGTANITYD